MTHRYFAALVSGNGKELCSLATEQAKRQLFGGEARTTSCPEKFRVLYEGVIREFREAHRSDPLGELRKVKVDVVSLSGKNARARVTLPAGDVTDVPLSKTAVGWRVGGQAGSPTAIELATPVSVKQAGGTELAEFEAGKKVVAQSGCLACHKIGENGNAGPGPDLTHIAARLKSQAIARTLVNPTKPMPSFKNLPPQKFKSVVAFLSLLK